MVTDYNSIALDYQKTKANSIKQYSEAYTLFQRLGDVRGKRVLDLACGDGYYSRAIRLAGAEAVLGVDVSREMIQLGQTIEAEKPLGIEYRVGDVAELGLVGSFDVVTAVFLLQYAADENGLQQMVDCIYLNLKPGGRFIAITGNPELSAAHIAAQVNYGVIIEPQGVIENGVTLRNTLETAGGRVQFRNRHWSKTTYERVCRQAGFGSVDWQAMQVSPEGQELFGGDYWQPFLSWPAIILLECVKN